jgi:dolichol-phosphate mannosyltransferase
MNDITSNKLISIVTPTFNEEFNVLELYDRIKNIIKIFPLYSFELIFIDNASNDGTVNILKSISKIDNRVKIIINTRNFGHIRSPYYGLMQANGSAVIYLASDLQDPPELIKDFIYQWEKGYKLVMAIKPASETSTFFHLSRKIYYKFLNIISDVKILENATGFGLYDKVVIDYFKKIKDPYPYLRGFVCELGYKIKTIEFVQPSRKKGFTKNNIYTLYDIGLLGIINHSKLPLRILSFASLSTGFLSILFSFYYIISKLLFWSAYPIGMSPLIIGLFFMFGLLFILLGFLSEYILNIHVKLSNYPIVVEQERINF